MDPNTSKPIGLIAGAGDVPIYFARKAQEMGLTVMASASMMQARLSQNLPDFLSEHLPGLQTDSQRAIQFVRSTPGITTALVGMSQEAHVRENLHLVGVKPASPDAIQSLLHAA